MSTNPPKSVASKAVPNDLPRATTSSSNEITRPKSSSADSASGTTLQKKSLSPEEAYARQRRVDVVASSLAKKEESSRSVSEASKLENILRRRLESSGIKKCYRGGSEFTVDIAQSVIHVGKYTQVRCRYKSCRDPPVPTLKMNPIMRRNCRVAEDVIDVAIHRLLKYAKAHIEVHLNHLKKNKKTKNLDYLENLDTDILDEANSIYRRLKPQARNEDAYKSDGYINLKAVQSVEYDLEPDADADVIKKASLGKVLSGLVKGKGNKTKI